MLVNWFSIRNLQHFLPVKENRAIHHCPATDAEDDKLQQKGCPNELETGFKLLSTESYLRIREYWPRNRTTDVACYSVQKGG